MIIPDFINLLNYPHHMIILLSPAKRMDLTSPLPPAFFIVEQGDIFTEPAFAGDAWKIALKMKEYSPLELSGLLHINPNLAMGTAEKFASFRRQQLDFAKRPALMAYKGDAYRGLDTTTMQPGDLLYSQDHLRILSALYGLLRPLDLIQAYRLEIALPLQVDGKKNLHDYWKEKITKKLQEELAKEEVPLLINLASLEYFSAVNTEKLKVRIITPVFKEYRNGAYKILSTHAKFARGRMSRFILDRRITDPEQIKLFDLDGYAYDANLSTGDRWVFTR
jgi:cytoplasmic iron level regulating protein YaaA (DUF328/UPF0246 family)